MTRLFDPGPGTFDFDLWTTADATSREGVFRLAESHSREPYFALQVAIRYCESSPIDLIEHYGDYFHFADVRRSAREAGSGVIRLAARGADVEAYLACTAGSQPRVWLLSTSAKTGTPEYDRLLLPLLQRLGSRIQSGWLSSRELEKALLAFQASLTGTLSPGRVASRGFDRSTIEYLRAASLEQVISELRQSRLLMQSLDFKVHSNEPRRLVLAAAANRSLRVVYRGGQSVLLERYFVPELEKLLLAHMGNFAVTASDWASQRIVYRFEQDTLMSRESHARLVDALAAQSRLSVCAFHLNPYLNVSVTDLADGSSMSLISDSEDSMYVMPGQRCSPGAVSRVLDTVYASFGAGRVSLEGAPEEDWAATCGVST